jgi:phage terminase small subunit
MPEKARKTEARWKLFAHEYVIDLNGSRAAIAAGYSERRAAVTGSELVRKRKVAVLIDKLQSARASKLELKAEQVVEELRRLAFSNMLDYLNVVDGDPRLDFSTLTRDQAAAIQEIREDTTGGSGDGERRLILRTKFKLADKTKALDMLMRHLGAYNDKVNFTGLEGLADKLAEIRKAKNAGVAETKLGIKEI